MINPQIKQNIFYKILSNRRNLIADGNMLTFAELNTQNFIRCEESFHLVDDWELCQYGNALAGEVGEACNYIKKLERGDDIDLFEIGRELADVVMYADLLATRLGFDLGCLVKLKFNEVSNRVGSDVKITAE